jgi:hypothetical protein
MTSDVKRHTGHYSVLALVLASGFFLFSWFNYDLLLQRLVVIAVGLAYVLWGIVHHMLSDKATTKIVLEYSLVALIGYLIINALLLGR